ncbi:MAG: DDE-type integrase/transposase/recombinase [Arsenophonus sp. NEOnobi-MAG3]
MVYLHVDVKYPSQMLNKTSGCYLFLGIDRSTRRVFIRLYNAKKTEGNVRHFLRDLDLKQSSPIAIHRVLTDNGKEFTDHLFCLQKRSATGKEEFTSLCTEHGIEHRHSPASKFSLNEWYCRTI